jgi:hypothetical protein
MTDPRIDTLRLVRFAEVLSMSKPRKVHFLATHGWRKTSNGNVWRRTRDGLLSSFGRAVVLAAREEVEEL